MWQAQPGEETVKVAQGYPCAPETWICPKCSHEQTHDFEWCGKNLKCQACGEYVYYSGWTVKS